MTSSSFYSKQAPPRQRVQNKRSRVGSQSQRILTPSVAAHQYGPGECLPLSQFDDDDLFQSEWHSDKTNLESGVLSQILSTLEEQSRKIDTLMDSHEQLKLECNSLKDSIRIESDNSSCSSTPSRPKKRVVTRILTDKINHLHESLSSEKKMKANESSTSPHNKEVKDTLMKELKNDPDNTFSDNTISLAVKRKYELERRMWKENKEGEESRAKRIKKAKYDQRKIRIYNRRKSVVTENEMEYFSLLSKDAMSEESDASDHDSEYIVVHKHPWRSKRVNLWMEELDKRYKQRQQQQNCSTPTMIRKVGNLALSVPPHGTPNWAIDSLWHEENSGCANGIQKDNKDDDESQNLQAVVEFTPE